MKTAKFVAQCDVEVGDLVTREDGSQWVIAEIRAIHYYVSGMVEFEFMLMHEDRQSGWLQRDQFKYRGK